LQLSVEQYGRRRRRRHRRRRPHEHGRRRRGPCPQAAHGPCAGTWKSPHPCVGSPLWPCCSARCCCWRGDCRSATVCVLGGKAPYCCRAPKATGAQLPKGPAERCGELEETRHRASAPYWAEVGAQPGVAACGVCSWGCLARRWCTPQRMGSFLAGIHIASEYVSHHTPVPVISFPRTASPLGSPLQTLRSNNGAWSGVCRSRLDRTVLSYSGKRR